MAKNIHNCPVCEAAPLEPGQLAEGLDAWCCAKCGGHWVRGTRYFEWLKSRKLEEPREDAGLGEAPKSDSEAGKLCIDCGRYMRRVAVGHGKSFFLDRCTSCGGFWFDAHEWASLQASGMHREAHQVFTDSWQAEVRRQAREQADKRRQTERLGAEGVEQIEAIKQWVAEHPRGDEILAMLTDLSN